MHRNDDGTFSCERCPADGPMEEREAAAHLYREHSDLTDYLQRVEVIPVPEGNTPRPQHVRPNRAQHRANMRAARHPRGGRPRKS